MGAKALDTVETVEDAMLAKYVLRPDMTHYSYIHFRPAPFRREEGMLLRSGLELHGTDITIHSLADVCKCQARELTFFERQRSVFIAKQVLLTSFRTSNACAMKESAGLVR